MRKSILAIVFTACISTAFASVADEAKALAEKGDAAAQYRYAEMLREGRGVAKNLREAVAWTRKAADGGLAAAQYQMYYSASRDRSAGRRAIALPNRAAAQGHAGAKVKQRRSF